MAPYHDYNVYTPALIGAMSLVKPKGFSQFRCKIPPGPAWIVGTNTGVCGNWFDTNSTTEVCGYIKAFVDALTAGSTILVMNIIYHMEFRFRTF